MDTAVMKTIKGIFSGFVLALVGVVWGAPVYHEFPPSGMTYTPTTGLTLGSPTGGAQGLGTINTKGIFVDGGTLCSPSSFFGPNVGCQSSSIGKQLTAAYTPTISNPTAMTWSPIWTKRDTNPFAPAMEVLYDPVAFNAGIWTVTHLSLATNSYVNGFWMLGTPALSNGAELEATTVALSGASWSVSLEHIVPTPDTGINIVGVGMAQNDNNVSWCYAQVGTGAGAQQLNIVDVVSGSFTIRAQTTAGSLPANITALATSFGPGGTSAAPAMSVTCWYKVITNGVESNWYPALTYSYATAPWDVVSPAGVATFHPMIFVNGGTTTPWQIGGVRYGSMGQLVSRDWKIVSNYDGTPYVSNGYMYFTADDPYATVYQVNPTTGVVTKVGQLLFNYGGNSNVDFNAKIVWDPRVQQWRIFWASWHVGLNSGIKLYSTTFLGDILSGFHVISGGVQIAVTRQASNAVYDEDVVWDGTKWLISYVVSPGGSFGGNFYVTLDSTTDFSTFTNVWAASGTTGYEGSAISKIGGNFYVTAGNGSQFDVWNTASATPLGTMNVSSFPSPSGNPPPHFVVFPWQDAGVTSYYALSWNNTQYAVGGATQGLFAAGTLMLYKAAQTETGFEFPSVLGVR